MIVEQRVIDKVVNSEISVDISPLIPLVALIPVCVAYLIRTLTKSNVNG